MLNPRKNSFGNLFSTENPSALRNELGIQDSEMVLDAGCGGQPLPWAKVHIDKDLNDGNDRDGKPVPRQMNIIQADICSMPFADKIFDWALCIHVLEHVASPEKACEELMRVARRGFIETPWKGSEIFAGYPSHRWLISLDCNTLVFEQRTYIENPFENFMMAQAQGNKAFGNLCTDVFRNVTCIQFVWEGPFKYRVERASDDKAFNYDNPEHASKAHASYAINLFRHGGTAETALYHLEFAFKMTPDSEYVQDAAKLILSLIGSSSKGREFIERLNAIIRKPILF